MDILRSSPESPNPTTRLDMLIAEGLGLHDRRERLLAQVGLELALGGPVALPSNFPSSPGAPHSSIFTHYTPNYKPL